MSSSASDAITTLPTQLIDARLEAVPVIDRSSKPWRKFYRRKTPVVTPPSGPLIITVTTDVSTASIDWATAPPRKPLAARPLISPSTIPRANRLRTQVSRPPVTLRSSTERGLCEVCARFNWEYHLTKEVTGLRRSSAFHAEEALNGDLHSKRLGLYPFGRRKITDAPYTGTYRITYAADELELDDLPSMIRKRRECSLCRLVVSAMESQMFRPDALERLADRAHLHPTRCCIESPVTSLNRHVLSILPFGAYTEVQFTLTGVESEKLSHRVPNAPQIDFQMVRSWVNNCRETHAHGFAVGGDHTIEVRERAIGSYLKLINVHSCTVVPAPPHCHYVALSYVWGNVPQSILNTWDFTTSGSSKFAKLNVCGLPRTIQDAISLTRLLGETYLWVDCLCITQDDLTERKVMIHAMHQVYRAAALTIIAANGSDSNAGLPGVFPTPREITSVVGIVDGINVMASETPSLNLKNTVWGTRCWTYQERWFSTRSLIFANQRVYYECSHGLLCELQPDHPLPSAESYLEHRGARYGDHVRLYTARKLSFDHDILNAFTAILTDEKARYGTNFCWGLPVEDFVVALQWKNASYQVRRTGSSLPRRFIPLKRRLGGQPGQAAHFPSWAWAGWKGAVYYEHWSSHQYSAVIWATQLDSLADDVYQTGILDIEVDMVPIESSTELELYMDDFNYHAMEPGDSDKLMTMSLCLVATSYLVAVFLVVEQGVDGIYKRRGYGISPLDAWKSGRPQLRRINLG